MYVVFAKHVANHETCRSRQRCQYDKRTSRRCTNTYWTTRTSTITSPDVTLKRRPLWIWRFRARNRQLADLQPGRSFSSRRSRHIWPKSLFRSDVYRTVRHDGCDNDRKFHGRIIQIVTDSSRRFFRSPIRFQGFVFGIRFSRTCWLRRSGLSMYRASWTFGYGVTKGCHLCLCTACQLSHYFCSNEI
jgi:hypothetical protein